MLLSKTQIEIMKVATSRITAKFSIREIAGLAKKQYPLVHRSIKPLIENRLLSRDERGLLSVNHRENLPAISYVESLRTEAFLEKNKTVGLFAKDVLAGLKEDPSTLLVFGSSAAGKQAPRDVDILLITEKNERDAETMIERIASNFTLTFHCTTISVESAREMLSKRGDANVMNETLGRHILLFGAENYYRLLKHAG